MVLLQEHGGKGFIQTFSAMLFLTYQLYCFLKFTMKNSRLHLLLLCLVTVLSFSCDKAKEEQEEITPIEETEKKYTLRVLTYNIFHGETTSGKIDMDLFAGIIKAENPDLVALQEVDINTNRSGRIDEVAQLSAKTGLTGYFAKARVFDGGDYGVAVLSKLPVEDFKVVPAYKTGTFGTAHAFAKVKIDENKYIYFNSAHLSTTLEERSVQVRELVNYYNVVLKKEPLLICGDLNAQKADPEMQPFWVDFNVSDVELGNTFSTRTGMRSKIDFILYPKVGNWRVVSTKRICRPDASDHCAFLSVLEFTK